MNQTDTPQQSPFDSNRGGGDIENFDFESRITILESWKETMQVEILQRLTA